MRKLPDTPALFENFGFAYKKKKHLPTESPEGASFVPKKHDDGAAVIDAVGGAYGLSLDIEGNVRNEYELITRYRDIALYPEVDSAIDDIVNEAIVSNSEDPAVVIVLDNVDSTEKLKDKIREEFDNVLKLLNFNNECYQIFRTWYVDGKLYYHKIVDTSRPQLGITEVRYIDPRQIRKVRKINRSYSKAQNEQSATQLIEDVEEYFLFYPRGVFSVQANVGLKINPDAITYVHSGNVDQRSMMVLSYLHKAIKPTNQLKMIEDAMVIYRLSRSAERRIFYIDTGNLPKQKAEQYVQNLMNRFRQKMVYDPVTGEQRTDKAYYSMMEDYWMPRREGSTATQIETLRGAENLGEIADVTYFQQKLYKALNVPVSRLDHTANFTLGRATEITRDEVKFGKFIARLRKRFSQLFDDLLCTQLLLKNICTREEWEVFREDIYYDFISDTYFTELKEAEIERERLSLVGQAKEYVGTYYSHAYIRRKLLKQTDDEIESIDKEIEEEKSKYGEPQENGGFSNTMSLPPMNQVGNIGENSSENDEDDVSVEEKAQEAEEKNDSKGSNL